MNALVLTTVGQLIWLFAAVTVLVVVAFVLAYRAGIEVGRAEGADERAALKARLRGAVTDPDVFVDLAREYGIGTAEEVTS